ncbi:Kdo hydroxylase family protein [Candidatus Paracaedibacter symbiosus]|uniref:Kdo hydroxylase family protein n=1 Tax=Candidatus Paracaedibacter symbiosus TaxID=244582 RepID=UPI000509D677|nr:Kdo hydroxylase family protein [Candidatus Paracaedibacter symbiosus]
MPALEFFETIRFDEKLLNAEMDRAIQAIENGKVLFFPNLKFILNEQETEFLTPNTLDAKSKNISYDHRRQQLKGTSCKVEKAAYLQAMMHRFCESSQKLVATILPQYQPHIHIARTSFRPAEIEGRVTSFKKDDTRLHVDAFPATPNQGTRILRVFSNVNPLGKPRVWRLGEPFEKVARQFLPRIKKPFPGSRCLLHKVGLTKSYRTLYDHYMLQMHDQMKADINYQQTAEQETIHFPAGGTWIVMTDQVSHAAMSGQHLFEQTIHLPVTGMAQPELSPLKILERLTEQKLV